MSRIELKDVSVEFPIYGERLRSLRHRLLEGVMIGGQLEADSAGTTIIKALSDVSLIIEDGQSVALIGGNGAGKTTLLKVVSGALTPISGTVDVTGNVSTLIDVQLGIDPEATGMENIMLRGLSLGMTRREVMHEIDSIAEFSELGRYLLAPTRTYSRGMRLRLALAVALSIDPEILLLDEWIGGGDAQFAKKSQLALRELVDKSNILVLATHNLALIREICTHAVLFDHGRLVCHGPAAEVLDEYIKT